MTGDIIDGKYRIDKKLGAGGMGNVYLATHLGTTRVVAIKVIAPKWAAEPQFLGRFQREAQACGRLRHPNIVNVTDFGVARGAGAERPRRIHGEGSGLRGGQGKFTGGLVAGGGESGRTGGTHAAAAARG